MIVEEFVGFIITTLSGKEVAIMVAVAMPVCNSVLGLYLAKLTVASCVLLSLAGNDCPS